MSDFSFLQDGNLPDSTIRGGQCLQKDTFLTQKLMKMIPVLRRESNPRQPTEPVLDCSSKQENR